MAREREPGQGRAPAGVWASGKFPMRYAGTTVVGFRGCGRLKCSSHRGSTGHRRCLPTSRSWRTTCRTFAKAVDRTNAFSLVSRAAGASTGMRVDLIVPRNHPSQDVVTVRHAPWAVDAVHVTTKPSSAFTKPRVHMRGVSCPWGRGTVGAPVFWAFALPDIHLRASQHPDAGHTAVG